VDVPWWIFAVLTFAVVWALTVTFLIFPAHGSSYVAPLEPSQSPHMFGGILAGMVFSVLALSGFEAPAPLAQETRKPGKFIGRAVMLSLFLIGGFSAAPRRTPRGCSPSPAAACG
jgi:amino acid transporter